METHTNQDQVNKKKDLKQKTDQILLTTVKHIPAMKEHEYQMEKR
jgi:hypothetical protein